MSIASTLAEWFNVRPPELRKLGLAVLGAFLILSYVILTRSLREAFFLTLFEVKRLPWMIMTVVVCSLPAVGQFSRLLSISQPRHVVRILVAVQAGGLLPLVLFLPSSGVAVVLFYLWTALGALLLTSGFWVIVSDQFPLRGAKRLFGLIGAGGTAGAMLTGISLNWLTRYIDLAWLVVVSAGLLVAFTGALSLLVAGDHRPSAVAIPQDSARGKLPILESARLVWNREQLRSIAFVIFCATVMTTLVDYQFKDLARSQLATGADLAAYFGGLYGWAGLVALAMQLLITGRLLERTRLGVILGFSPVLMILGGVGLMVGPGMLLATAVRGADYSLRKALYRPAIEVLFVPVPPWLRRKTKTFLDSLVDAGAEGFGSLLILMLVAGGGLPSRFLAAVVILVALVYLSVLRRLDRQYFRAVSERLREESGRHREAVARELPSARDLLSATFTDLDLSSLQVESSIQLPERKPAEVGDQDDLLDQLTSPEDVTVLGALNRIETWNPAHIDVLARLIARDSMFKRVIRLLQRFPDDSVPPAVALLRDAEIDFTIRRRIPDLLAKIGGEEADEALIDALTDHRFEVRYRAALALVSRRKLGLPEARRDWRMAVWHALSMEVRRNRPLWELQRLLDSQPDNADDLVTKRVGIRGEYSLEHTFRLLTLVLDPEQVRAAYHGVILDDPQLKSFALEYLEHVLPGSIRHRLWSLIGDHSERQKQRQARPLDAVVADLMVTSQTLFQGDVSRIALKKMVSEYRDRRTS